MAKTESTAVNELISLVQGGSKPIPDPSADLFSSEPAAPRVAQPRMTSPIPAMRGAGEVAPLPRGRAPQSTSTHAVPPPSPVRMKTASPARGTTIPPLARPSTPPPIPGANEAKVTHSSPTIESPRITRPSLPPPKPSRPTLPVPRTTASGIPVPPIPRVTQTHAVPPPSPIEVEIKFEATPTMPTPSTPAAAIEAAPSPFAAPAVSPFAAPEPQAFPVVVQKAKSAPIPVVVQKAKSAPIPRLPSVDLTADVIRGDNWFEASSKVEKLHEETWVGGRYTAGHRKSLKDWARMLAVPAIVAASVGVAIGVYISYRSDSHAAPKASASAIPTIVHAPPPSKIVNLPQTSTAPDPNAESSNAATASAGGDVPLPPTKQEDAAKQEAAQAQAAANPNDPAAEPTLTHDVAQPAVVQPAAQPAGDAPAVQEIKTSHGIVKLVDVRINSKPAGATVMLVDDGKTSFLGTTPLATSVDASKTYDVIFTLNGRPTQMAHLDPASSAKLDISLPRGHHGDAPVETPSAPMPNDTTLETAAKAETPKAVAKVEAPKAKIETPKAEKIAKTETPKAVKTEKVAKTETPKAAKASKSSFDEEAELRSLGLEPKKAKKADAAAGGEGTLMVSSKPPCEIYVDGKATGLTTPQRSMALPAGSHKITFVNSGENIKKTVAVTITADKSTKLIQDLMAK